MQKKKWEENPVLKSEQIAYNFPVLEKIWHVFELCTKEPDEAGDVIPCPIQMTL